jgi:predicted amidohydrolase YtcJ
MKNQISVLALIVLLLSAGCNFKSENVDLIVHNAVIYTVDNEFAQVEAMAILDGKIVATGPEREILNIYKANEIIDAAGKSIFPGFIDSHCHFVAYGLSLEEVDLTGTRSWIECIDRMQEEAGDNKKDWLVGRGWDQNDWDDKEFPTYEALNVAFPDRPVVMHRVDIHALIANQAALDIAGVSGYQQVSGGKMVTYEDGSLTGVFIDNAMPRITNSIAEPTIDQLKKAINGAEEDCLAVGLTTVDEAGLDTTVVNLIRTMHQQGELAMRVYAMLEPTDPSKHFMKQRGIIQEDRLTVRSIKLYGDGSLGSRGAALKRDYHDHSGHSGSMINPPLFYKQWAALCDLYGYQMNVHCIGDKANQILLAVYKDQLGKTNDKRWRIEHAQVLTGNDIDAFGRYNILPSIQPTHATSDMPWAASRLGEERMAGAYAYASLLSQNGIALLGTDFPIEGISPIETFYAAVFRKSEAGLPQGGWHTEEALSREQAMRGMTLWGAVGNFEEKTKGSLEVGKVADFVILDRDLMKAPEGDILKTKVLKTYIAGEKVHG